MKEFEMSLKFCSYRMPVPYSENLATCASPLYCADELRFGNSKYCKLVLEYEKERKEKK